MMVIGRLIRRLDPCRFAADSRAVAATEFALILPVMLILYLGGIEASQMISVDRKTAFATRTVADLVSRLSNCKNATVPSEMSGVFKATDAVVSPFNPTQLKVVVSCLAVDKNGVATVMWSSTQRGTARTAAATFTPPAGLSDATELTYWVMGEASYTYKPILGYVLTGNIELYEKVFMNSRL